MSFGLIGSSSTAADRQIPFDMVAGTGHNAACKHGDLPMPRTAE